MNRLMRLVEVCLVQCGAAQACYQPITGQAWQSWGLGEESGGRKRLITITAHAQCGSGERGCGAVKSACRDGWVFDSVPLPPSLGESHDVCTGVFFCAT